MFRIIFVFVNILGFIPFSNIVMVPIAFKFFLIYKQAFLCRYKPCLCKSSAYMNVFIYFVT